jgi:NADH:ubiquinone oxidoreductase subunit E
MSKFTIPTHTLYICTGSKCAKRGGKDGYKAAKSYRKMLPGEIDLEVIRTECTDRCDYAPVCALQPGNTWLKEYRVKHVLALIDELAAAGN